MDLRELVERYRADCERAFGSPPSGEGGTNIIIVAACLWFLTKGFAEVAAGFAFTQTPEFHAAIIGMMKQMGIEVMHEGGEGERVH